MRITISILAIFLSLHWATAQKYMAKRNIQIGTSIFYIPTLDFEEKNTYCWFEFLF